jgi:P-type E1-E2 ATPase
VLIHNYIPSIAINSPAVVTAVLSIIFIIGISKEGITDYIRYKSDKKINAIECIKIENGDQKHVVKLQDVKVGDVLFLSDKQIVPADCDILGIKDADISGCGYIQTAQLDGERNLESKMPCTQVQQ